jgi:hypothetical protein
MAISANTAAVRNGLNAEGRDLSKRDSPPLIKTDAIEFRVTDFEALR